MTSRVTSGGCPSTRFCLDLMRRFAGNILLEISLWYTAFASFGLALVMRLLLVDEQDFHLLES